MKAGFAWACEYGRTSVVDFLLRNGMAVDDRLKPHGQTALHWAAYGAHADTVKLLLRRKAPLDAKDQSFHNTPLGWALHAWGDRPPEFKNGNYYDVVALLVAAGAALDPEWRSDEKVRADPRMLAALGGSR
jgi:ankyrin repeat protein